MNSKQRVHQQQEAVRHYEQIEGNYSLVQPHANSVTNSKKRKFNEISSTSALQQLESLNLSGKFASVASCGLSSKGRISVTAQYEKSDSMYDQSFLYHYDSLSKEDHDDHAVRLQQPKRRKLNEISNIQQNNTAATTGQELNQYITLKKQMSKEKRQPFQTLYNSVNEVNLVRFKSNVSDESLSEKGGKGFPKLCAPACKDSLKASKTLKEHTAVTTKGSLNGRNLRRMMSPKRLSHISERSADELHTALNHTSNKKVELVRRSSSVGDRERQERVRVSSILANASNRSSICGSVIQIRSSSVFNNIRGDQKVETSDHCSDIAQLGTPHHFEGNDEEMPIFCSQSAISVADCMSEMSSQFDFFREAHPQVPSLRGRSSPMDQNTAVGGAHIPFILTPLNEFDEEFENPLNKAMIIDSTATGFTWSKPKQQNLIVPSTASSIATEHHQGMLLSADGDLLVKEEEDAHTPLVPFPNPFKYQQEYEDMNHSF